MNGKRAAGEDGSTRVGTDSNQAITLCWVCCEKQASVHAVRPLNLALIPAFAVLSCLSPSFAFPENAENANKTSCASCSSTVLAVDAVVGNSVTHFCYLAPHTFSLCPFGEIAQASPSGISGVSGTRQGEPQQDAVSIIQCHKNLPMVQTEAVIAMEIAEEM